MVWMIDLPPDVYEDTQCCEQMTLATLCSIAQFYHGVVLIP